MNLKRFVLTVAALLFPLTLSATPPQEVKIGAVIPLSGYAQAFGQEARLALIHAIEDAPKRNFTYTVKFEDDRGSAAEAVRAAQKLLSLDSVNVIFFNWSYGGLAVASAVKGKPATHFSFAWDTAVTGLSENSFLIAPPAELLGEAVLTRLRKEGVKRIALLHMDESGASYAMDTVERAAAKGSIAVAKRFKIDTVDLSSIKVIATQIKELSPEYLVTSLTLPQYLGLFRNLKTLRHEVAVASIGQNPETSEFKKIHPRVWWSVDYSADEKTVQSIRKRTGLQDLSGYSAFYDGMRAIISVYESLPAGQVPSAHTFQERLNLFSDDQTLLGKLFFKDRIRRSTNIQMVDQATKYSGGSSGDAARPEKCRHDNSSCTSFN